MEEGDKTAPKWFSDALGTGGAISNSVQEQESVNALKGVDGESGDNVPHSKAKRGAGTWKERSELLKRLQEEQPTHVLELCKELGLFTANPDCPQDVFLLMAIARVKKQPISDDMQKHFDFILEEVDRFLPELSCSEGRLEFQDSFYIPLEGRETVLCMCSTQSAYGRPFQGGDDTAQCARVGLVAVRGGPRARVCGFVRRLLQNRR